MNKLINAVVDSLQEEDLEYLIMQAKRRLLKLEDELWGIVDYEILCSCGHTCCPACRGLDLKVEYIK